MEMKVHTNLKFANVLKLSNVLCDEGLLTCNSALMNLLSARDRLHWSETKGLLLDCSTGAK